MLTQHPIIRPVLSEVTLHKKTITDEKLLSHLWIILRLSVNNVLLNGCIHVFNTRFWLIPVDALVTQRGRASAVMVLNSGTRNIKYSMVPL